MVTLWASALAEEAATVTEEVTEVVEETAAKADPTWAQKAVEKFTETPGTGWIALGVLVVIGIILLAIAKTSKKWTAKTVAFGALAIALSFVLSCIRLYRMPQGGSVTPGSMLPLMLFSAAFGIGPGLLAGLAYGVLQYLQGGWWLNVWQFILDYLLAFATDKDRFSQFFKSDYRECPFEVENEYLTISTIHSAKGLEWDNVCFQFFL